MDIKQKVVKDEIDIHDDFVWNMDVKQEISDEMPRYAFQNVDTNCMHLIKQEINDDLNTVQIFGESMVVPTTERDSSHKVNIRNKFKYLQEKTGRRTKSKRLLRNGNHVDPNTIAGIMICGFCGHLYTKQIEFLCHFSTNHCVTRKKLLYRTKFHQNNINCKKSQVTNIIIPRNLDEDVKNEIEIVEHDLKAELQYIGFTDNFKFGIDEGQKYKRSDLNRHLFGHAGEKLFKCDICLKSFTSNNYLNQHLRTHTGEKRFKCDICLKSFLRKENLERHLRIHTGDKPFECGICMKSFPRKEHLMTHLHIHTGEKPFKCDICLKSFVRKDHLKRHLHIHTGNKPFKCDICLKAFSEKDSLKKHMHTHTR